MSAYSEAFLVNAEDDHWAAVQGLQIDSAWRPHSALQQRQQGKPFVFDYQSVPSYQATAGSESIHCFSKSYPSSVEQYKQKNTNDTWPLATSSHEGGKCCF